jgi:hypothetical protein
MFRSMTITRELTLEPGYSYTYVITIGEITSLYIKRWCGSMLCPGMVCVLCAVRGLSHPAQHTVHIHNMLPHHCIIHNDVILPTVLT